MGRNAKSCRETESGLARKTVEGTKWFICALKCNRMEAGWVFFYFSFLTKLVLMCVRCVSSAAAPDRSLIRDAHLHKRLSHLGWFMQHRQRLNVASLVLFFPTDGTIWYQWQDTLQKGQTGKVSITKLCKKFSWYIQVHLTSFLKQQIPLSCMYRGIGHFSLLLWCLSFVISHMTNVSAFSISINLSLDSLEKTNKE